MCCVGPKCWANTLKPISDTGLCDYSDGKDTAGVQMTVQDLLIALRWCGGAVPVVNPSPSDALLAKLENKRRSKTPPPPLKRSFLITCCKLVLLPQLPNNLPRVKSESLLLMSAVAETTTRSDSRSNTTIGKFFFLKATEANGNDREVAYVGICCGAKDPNSIQISKLAKPSGHRRAGVSLTWRFARLNALINMRLTARTRLRGSKTLPR